MRQCVSSESVDSPGQIMHGSLIDASIMVRVPFRLLLLHLCSIEDGFHRVGLAGMRVAVRAEAALQLVQIDSGGVVGCPGGRRDRLGERVYAEKRASDPLPSRGTWKEVKRDRHTVHVRCKRCLAFVSLILFVILYSLLALLHPDTRSVGRFLPSRPRNASLAAVLRRRAARTRRTADDLLL